MRRRRRYRRNADESMRKGLRVFLSGGAHELPGEALARIRDTADRVLWEDGHIPVRGGPVADEGWVWVRLDDAYNVLEMRGREANDRLLGGQNLQEPIEHVLGSAEEWGLVGPIKSWHLEIDEDPMSMLGPGVYYRAWLLVPREPNAGSVGEWAEE